MNLRPAILLLPLLLLAGCKPSRPDYVLSEKKMEDVLVDYHLAQGIAETQSGNREVNIYRNVQAVFRKHRITEERFDSSLIYYSTYSEKFARIYKQVALRVETQASLMGAEAQPRPVDKYEMLTSEGDTANIWSAPTLATLQPAPLQNLYSFHIPADSTFRTADSFLWRFRTLFRLEGSLREVYSVLLARYTRPDGTDTVANIAMQLNDSRLFELRIEPSSPLDTLPLKSISGYIFWSLPDAKERDKFALLVLSNLSLIRFHKEVAEPQAEVAADVDSISSDSTIALPDTLQPVRLSPMQRRQQQPREQKQRIRHESPVDPALLNPTLRRRR